MGKAWSISSGLPPAMISRVPASASLEVRPTGASTIRLPDAARLSAVASKWAGNPVLMSMRSAAGSRASAMPPGPRTASATCRPVGSMVITYSAPSAASRAAPASPAPCLTTVARADGLVSNARTRWPAFSRFRAIGAPITPTPMNPTLLIPPSVRRLERSDRSRTPERRRPEGVSPRADRMLQASANVRGIEHLIAFWIISSPGLRPRDLGADPSASVWDSTPGRCLATRELNLSHTRYTLHGNRKYQWSGADVDPDRVRDLNRSGRRRPGLGGTRPDQGGGGGGGPGGRSPLAAIFAFSPPSRTLGVCRDVRLAQRVGVPPVSGAQPYPRLPPCP